MQLQCTTETGYQVWRINNSIRVCLLHILGRLKTFRIGVSLLGNNGPSLKLGQDTVAPSNNVHVLDVSFSSDLSLDDDVAHVSVTCFY